MESERIERQAAETILESGVRVKLPAPLFLRLFGKKTVNVTIHRPKLRTMLTATRLSLQAGFSIDSLVDGSTEAALDLVDKHTETVCHIVSVHILNGRRKNRLFSKKLGNYLLSSLTSDKLLGMAVTIILMSRYQDFTTTIRLFKTMRMTTTAPKNLSPDEQGSQKAT